MSVRAAYLRVLRQMDRLVADEQRTYRTALLAALERIPEHAWSEATVAAAIRGVNDIWYGSYAGDPRARLTRLLLTQQQAARDAVPE